MNVAVGNEPSALAGAGTDAWKTRRARPACDGDGFCENAAASEGGGALE